MQRYVNTFLRNLWLFAIPLLVTPVVVALLFRPLPSYTATAALWVEQALYVEPEKNTDGSPFDTPAVNQADYFQDLINTHTFITTLVEAALNKGFNLDKEQQTQLEIQISKEFQIKPVGDYLIQIEYKDIDPKLATIITQSAIDNFYKIVTDRVKEQGESSLKTFEKRVSNAKDDYDRASDQARQYISQHPGAVGAISDQDGTSFIRTEDLEYNTLLQLQSTRRVRYEQLDDQFKSLLISYGAFVTGQDSIIKIRDQAAITKSVIYEGNSKVITGAILGLVVGLLLAVLALLVITWTDNSIQERAYARQLLRIEPVLALPEVHPVGGRRWRLGKTFSVRRSYAKHLGWLSK